MGHRREEECISVALTHEILNPLPVMAEVKSPKAGAIVLFAGKLSTHLQPPLPSQSYQVLHATTSTASPSHILSIRRTHRGRSKQCFRLRVA